MNSSPEAQADDGLRACDDRQLVTLCLDGRRDAFDVIVERYQRQVYQLCYRFVPMHEDASDLAQDVFVRAYRALGGFKGESALPTWLHRIAVNVCLTRTAAKAPAHLSLDAGARPIDVSDRRERADDALLRRERSAEVRSAIARLPGKQRATLILRIYHDLPHAEIAGILGSSVGATKANFFHALANLKKLLQGGQ